MTLTRPLRNGHYWIYLLHGMIVSPIISTVTFALTTVVAERQPRRAHLLVLGIVPPARRRRASGATTSPTALPWLFGGWSSWAVEVVLYLIAGVLFAITLPWAMGGFARVHHAVARGHARALAQPTTWPPRCGPKRPPAAPPCRPRDAALRRLERDIHDGPQQRLVRLQMDLAALERRAEAGDSDAAAELAREAQVHAKAALDELRALSSGVAPPLLQDRGLAAALARRRRGKRAAGGVGRSIRPWTRPSAPEVARTVYFVVAELLTNAVKHSGASARDPQGVAPARLGDPADAGRLGGRQRSRRARTSARATAWKGCATASRACAVCSSSTARSEVRRTVGAHIPLATTDLVAPAADPERMSDLYPEVMPARSRCGSSSSRTPCCCARGSCVSSTRRATSRPGRSGDADDIVERVRDAAADVAILDVRLPPAFRDEGIRAALRLRDAAAGISASSSSASTSRASTPASSSPGATAASATC